MIYLKTYNEYFCANNASLKESDTGSSDLQEDEDLEDEEKEENELGDVPENSPLALGFLPRPWDSTFNNKKIVIEPAVT